MKRGQPRDLYVHFPFCRSKCSYCVLHSHEAVDPSLRSRYTQIIARAIDGLDGSFDTVYFGGGTPALCDLGPIFGKLERKMAAACEFTVELHPADVTEELLRLLRCGGVNRISMGLQSFNDGILADMGRGYSFAQAAASFGKIRGFFDNAGVDIIAGYPGDRWREEDFTALAGWGITHCSVYSLQLEEGSRLYRRGDAVLPGDDFTMDAIGMASERLGMMGLERYEISNWALHGFECRHNLSVWRGNDYIGLGCGAHGREGLTRTVSRGLPEEGFMGMKPTLETVDPDFDYKERRIFSLRTREGLCTDGDEAWTRTLEDFAEKGLVKRTSRGYALTPRGCEVADSVISELV